MRPTLVVFHMEGCKACEALMPSLGLLRGVDVLRVQRGHPFEREVSQVWYVPRSGWYPEMLLAASRGVFRHRGDRSPQELQRWIDARR